MALPFRIWPVSADFCSLYITKSTENVSPDCVGVALEGVLTPALGPQPDGGVVGAGQEVAVRQHQHSLYWPLVAHELRNFAKAWPSVHPDRPALHAAMLGNL